MARLPQPGGDDGNWGSILNDFLSQVHKTDGTLKDNSVPGAAIVPNSVSETILGTTGGTNGQVLVKDNTVASGIKWGNPAAASAPVTSVNTKTGDVAW